MTTYINGVRTEKQKIRDAKSNAIKDNLTFGFFGCCTVILFLMAFHTPKAEAAIIIEKAATQPACNEFKNVQELDKLVDDFIDPQYTKTTDDFYKTIYISNVNAANEKQTTITEIEFNTLKSNYKNKIMLNHCEVKTSK